MDLTTDNTFGLLTLKSDKSAREAKMQRKIFKIIHLLLTIIIFIGCGSENVRESPNPISPLPTETTSSTLSSPLPKITVTVTPLPQPQESKATITGRIVSEEGYPISDVTIRIAEVYRQEEEGAFVLDDAFSPGSTTDRYGFFAIENIEPKEYVIVVGDPRTQYDIVSKGSGEAHVWEVLQDQILDVGKLEVDLHP